MRSKVALTIKMKHHIKCFPAYKLSEYDKKVQRNKNSMAKINGQERTGEEQRGKRKGGWDSSPCPLGYEADMSRD